MLVSIAHFQRLGLFPVRTISGIPQRMAEKKEGGCQAALPVACRLSGEFVQPSMM
jgi:hypothetical protein